LLTSNKFNELSLLTFRNGGFIYLSIMPCLKFKVSDETTIWLCNTPVEFSIN